MCVCVCVCVCVCIQLETLIWHEWKSLSIIILYKTCDSNSWIKWFTQGHKKCKSFVAIHKRNCCNCFHEAWNQIVPYNVAKGFPGGSNGKESACSAGDPSSVPGLRRSPGEGNG